MVAHIDESYSETKDLYLELLWQAQRVEDQKLVALIKERLRRRIDPVGAAEPCGNVIPFPAIAAGTISSPVLMKMTPLPSDEPSMWPRRPGRQGAYLFSAYCAVVLLFTFLHNI
jgi:hypothetical protein